MLATAQKTSDIDLRDAFFDALYDIAKDDPDVMCLAADMGAFSLNRFKKDLSRQYFNVGVAEQNIVSVAAGLALGDKKVFIYAIAPFITQRCYEQIKIDLSCMDLPVTLVGVGGGIAYGSDGPTHHATQDIAALRALPAMTILNPSDSTTASAAARIAYQSSGPVYVRIDKGRFPLVHGDEEDLADGLSLLRDGSDVLIVSTGIMVHRACEVADELRKHSIAAGIVDVFTLKPMNEKKLLGIMEQYNRVITLEEHSIIGGLGSAVAELVTDHQKAVPVKRIALADRLCEGYGDRQWMHEYYRLDVESVARTILDFCKSTESAATGEIPPASKTKSRGKILQSLKLADFADLFGTTVNDIPDGCRALISKNDFHYRALSGDERDAIILQVLKRIHSNELTTVGPDRKSVWEKGWAENLKNFVEKGYDLGELSPKYYRPNHEVRLRQDYIAPVDPNFEFNFFKVLRDWLFRKYLQAAGGVYEFGCGPGHNLVALAELYPDKKIYGLDWAIASRDLVNRIAEVHNYNITGVLFDLFGPDENLHIAPDAVALTIGCLEQLGDGYESFLQFLLRKSPMLCVNVEPFGELYDRDSLLDYLATQYQEKRKYLSGYVNRLTELSQAGLIEILKIQKVPFGGLYYDGWSFVVWRPRRTNTL